MVIIMKKDTKTTALKKLSEYLSAQKLRATTQRETILLTFIGMNKHCTAEELCDSLKEIDPTIGHATVYRALKLFKDASIAREINLNEGSIRYESIINKEPKDYLVCDKCSSVTEFVCKEIRKLQDGIAAKHNYTLKNRSHILFGICPKCKK